MRSTDSRTCESWSTFSLTGTGTASAAQCVMTTAPCAPRTDHSNGLRRLPPDHRTIQKLLPCCTAQTLIRLSRRRPKLLTDSRPLPKRCERTSATNALHARRTQQGALPRSLKCRQSQPSGALVAGGVKRPQNKSIPSDMETPVCIP